MYDISFRPEVFYLMAQLKISSLPKNGRSLAKCILFTRKNPDNTWLAYVCLYILLELRIDTGMANKIGTGIETAKASH